MALSDRSRVRKWSTLIESSRSLDARGNQNRVAHSVHEFLICGSNRGEGPTQFDSVLLDKEIWTETNATFHRFQFAGIGIPISMLKEPAFMKALHDRRRLLECRERVFDSFLPFRVRQIGTERNAAAAPAKRRKSTDFQKQIAIF